eukprot:TRINITY_DN3483_c0_g1_i1.p1 TRINITY_DN3483_c0_g1~~TRINITY_DN3483_c0_g1_i1.p1  ORF type:complete len:398 (+),score=89.09 TRINITY_DN3483_c0_g1_i1:121-1314(+)
MHPYAILYYIFLCGCYILFGVFWRIGLIIIRFLRWAYIALLYKIPAVEDRRKVVVIGGGFAGTCAAQMLEDFYQVTLIDTKEYFEFTPSVLRTIVDPAHVKRLQVLHTHYLRHSNVIQREVTSVQEKQVLLNDGRTVPYDYLIINTGSTYTAPFKESKVISSARANTLRESNYTIRKAKSVLIIGGGLVGVEMAAEIVCHFQGKEVILVHSQSTLINRFPKRAIRYCDDFLRSRGVRIILNERIVGNKHNVYTTDQGQEIHADLAFLCTGITPNSGFLRDHYADAISGNGYIRANDCLQLQGQVIYPNIFVAGDVLDMREEKLAQGAEQMASIVFGNINALERGKKPKQYISPTDRPVLISLGKFHAVFVFKGWTVTGPFPALLKEAVEWKTLMRYK